MTSLISLLRSRSYFVSHYISWYSFFFAFIPSSSFDYFASSALSTHWCVRGFRKASGTNKEYRLEERGLKDEYLRQSRHGYDTLLLGTSHFLFPPLTFSSSLPGKNLFPSCKLIGREETTADICAAYRCQAFSPGISRNEQLRFASRYWSGVRCGFVSLMDRFRRHLCHDGLLAFPFPPSIWIHFAGCRSTRGRDLWKNHFDLIFDLKRNRKPRESSDPHQFFVTLLDR